MKKQSNKFCCVPAAGAGPTMTSRLNVLLMLLLSLAAVSVLAQRRRQSTSSSTASSTSSGNSEWNYRDGCELLHASVRPCVLSPNSGPRVNFSTLLWRQRRSSLRLLAAVAFFFYLLSLWVFCELATWTPDFCFDHFRLPCGKKKKNSLSSASVWHSNSCSGPLQPAGLWLSQQ